MRVCFEVNSAPQSVHSASGAFKPHFGLSETPGGPKLDPISRTWGQPEFWLPPAALENFAFAAARLPPESSADSVHPIASAVPSILRRIDRLLLAAGLQAARRRFRS